MPKIPPLKSGRPQSKSDRLSALISKANEIKGRSPNPSSDGESNPASPAGIFHFITFIHCCKVTFLRNFFYQVNKKAVVGFVVVDTDDDDLAGSKNARLIPRMKI